MKKNYPRDMIGYGSKTPVIKWPNGAKIALQIVLNYEEGAENCVLHGDKMSEVFLSEIIGAQPIKGRHINMESFYEYGSKRGFWRLHKLFQEKKIPITIFGVGMALERNKDVCDAIKESDYEVASHGWRWIDYQKISRATEKKHMQLAIQSIKKIKDLEDKTQKEIDKHKKESEIKIQTLESELQSSVSDAKSKGEKLVDSSIEKAREKAITETNKLIEDAKTKAENIVSEIHAQNNQEIIDILLKGVK